MFPLVKRPAYNSTLVVSPVALIYTLCIQWATSLFDLDFR